jgi:hypothetical protein
VRITGGLAPSGYRSVSAQAFATAESAFSLPGIVAHPPFSMNVSRSQAKLIFFNSVRFADAFAAWRNWSTQIGARAASTAVSARSFATFSTELPSVHPPQLKPTIIAITAPAAAPCKRRLSESPFRIEGSSMTFTLRIRGARTASSARTCTIRMLIASEPERLFLECYCARRWHQRCRCGERRLRYVAAFWAALGQVATRPQMVM